MTASGDRHLRADPAVQLGRLEVGRRRVLVASGAAAAQTFAVQALLSLLVDLLARQFGVVTEIAIDVPAVEPQPFAFPGQTERLASVADELVRLGRRAAGPEIEVGRAEPVSIADISVWVGPGRPRSFGRLLTIRAQGIGNAAWCSTEEDALEVASDSRLPFGPHLAACLAADRVFRRFRGVDARGTFGLDVTTFGAPNWSADTGTPAIQLPSAYVVGLGAVGAAVLYTLAAAEPIGATFVGLDPQASDVSNRNRLLSAGYDDVGVAKSELASRLVASSGVELYPNSLTWATYSGDLDRRVPEDLRELEPFRFRWVLSCVDRNIGRRDIANVLPQHVLSGSTDGLVAQATYFSLIGEAECLACNHPIPSVDLDQLRDELGALTPEARRDRLVEAGLLPEDRAAVEDYLRDPDCGLVGQSVLRRLGVEGPIDWAVGFVSVAAGVMLAAQFFAVAGRPTVEPPTESERRLFFFGPGSAQASRARRKAACPVCSDPATRERYLARWR